MKKLIYTFVLAFLSAAVFSQGIIEREYSQYLDQDDVTHVFVSGKMFDFASTIAGSLDDEEAKEMGELASKIQSFSLIKVPNKDIAMQEFKRGKSTVSADFEELIRVRDEGTQFVLFVDEEDDVVYEVVGLGVVDGEFLAFSLIGEIQLEKVAEMLSNIDNGSLAPLKDISEFDTKAMKVYPNPVTSNSKFTVEVPEKMLGATVTIYDSNGNKIKSQPANGRTENLDTSDLPSGNYFIELQKESISMKKQLIVIK